MRKFIPLYQLAAFLFIGSLFLPASLAQGTEEEISKDTTEIKWNEKKLVIISDDEETTIRIPKKSNEAHTFSFGDDDDDDDDWDDDWDHYDWNWGNGGNVGFLAFDIGVTNYHDSEGTFGKDATLEDLELRVFRPGGHVALHFLPTTVPLIGRGAVSLKTALTVDFNNYYFTNDITLLPDQDSLTYSFTGEDFDRNKLFASYAQLPLMLHFDTRPGSSRGVQLSLGGYVGLLWGSRTKQKIGDDKIKIKDDFNLNPVRYGLTGRLRLRWFRLYVNYNLSDLFEEGEGPVVQTFSAGLNIFEW
ncbi:MAG: outer membrane beta-barrel protein [Bacteroidota bacterium]